MNSEYHFALGQTKIEKYNIAVLRPAKDIISIHNSRYDFSNLMFAAIFAKVSVLSISEGTKFR